VLTWRSRLPLREGSPEAWMQRGFRLLFVGTLLVVFLLGLRDIARPFLAGGQPHGQPAQPTASYPAAAAQAYAARFALAYLTYDAAHPDQRRQALQQYTSVDAAGWDGRGRQTAVLSLPSGIDVRDGTHALVTIAALVDGGRWVYLAVPVAAEGERLAVDGTPALVPAPRLAAAAALADIADQDPVLSSELHPDLTAFLGAYAASDQAELAYYAAPGVELAGLGGQVTLAGIDALGVEQPSGDVRSIVASVRWMDPASGGTLTQRYRLQIVQVSGKWLVGNVEAAI
jgi:hypothetical protein